MGNNEGNVTINPTFRESFVFHQPNPSRRNFLMWGRGSTQTPLKNAWTLLSPPQTVQGRKQEQSGLPKQRLPRLLKTEWRFSIRKEPSIMCLCSKALTWVLLPYSSSHSNCCPHSVSTRRSFSSSHFRMATPHLVWSSTLCLGVGECCVISPYSIQ